MSKNTNRAKYNKAHNGKEWKLLKLDEWYPPYWDEGIVFIGKITHYQARMYKTWKHTRKTQWKDL